MSQHPIFSIHIPKTGGTTFAEVLARTYGKRVAFAYGREHPRTHPRLKECTHVLDPVAVRSLVDDGIQVVHGHFGAADLAEVEPDPRHWWIWLRDPIERTISHYHFLHDQTGARSKLGRTVASGAMSVGGFAGHAAIRNLQSRQVGGVPIAAFGFVGITEHFAAGLDMLGLKMPGGRRAFANLNATKGSVDRATRAAIAAENIPDLALYSEAVQVFLGRQRDGLGAPAPVLAGGGLKRLFAARTKPRLALRERPIAA